MPPINRRVSLITPGPPGPQGPVGPQGPTGPTGGGDVDSVNGETGTVVLNPDHLDDTSSTHKFVTAEHLTDLDNLGVLASEDQIVVPDDINATGTPSASTSLHGDGVWRTPTSVARVSMSTPVDPQPGDTRWNLLEDPPNLGGGALDPTELYTATKGIIQSGTNVTVVTNDSNETITINASGGGGGGGGGAYRFLVATDYGMAPSASAAVNTAALKACIAAAGNANLNVFIPAGRYYVNPGCLTPPLGSAFWGLEVWGEGYYNRTDLIMSPQTTESYFYDNGTNGNTAAWMTFRDIGFLGGPTDTSTQRGAVNPNHNGFRFYGQPDQNIKFKDCRFATLNGVFYCPSSPNNASEIAFDHCKITHIGKYVLRNSNLQSVNIYFTNCNIEVIWGAIVWADPGTWGTQSGGCIAFTNGSIIVQRDGSSRGACVRTGGVLSGTVTFTGLKIEVRNDSYLVDGTAGGKANVNFISCTSYTTLTTGTVETCVVNTDQVVNFDMCLFEHNGSSARYTILGNGRLMFDRCGVRPNLQTEITKSANGTRIARDCYNRESISSRINFDT